MSAMTVVAPASVKLAGQSLRSAWLAADKADRRHSGGDRGR